MNDQPCKYIGCENSGTNHGRACYKCVQKYRGLNPKPPTHPRVNKWRKIEGRYKNIERKPPPLPEPGEEVKDFVQIFREKLMNEALEKARKLKPKPQFIEEKLKDFKSQKNYDDGFKQYSRFAEQDTVGQVNLPSWFGKQT